MLWWRQRESTARAARSSTGSCGITKSSSSPPILSEYEAVAGRPGQAPHRDALRFVIAEIERLAVTVEPAELMFGLRDPDDEVCLATAAAGGAILITGNTRDFTQPRYGPVETMVAARVSRQDDLTNLALKPTLSGTGRIEQ